MQFLVTLRRRTEDFTTEQFAEHLAPEVLRVRELYAAGTVREAFSRGDVPGAVLRLEVENQAEIATVLASLPLFARGMLEAQAIVPLKPYRGFVPE